MSARGTRTAGPSDPTRQYVLLSFLQWLPVGLMMVPMVLLLLERGLTLADVALVGAVSALTVAVLELPTGGLADVVGRRPVLVVSALAHAAALLVLGLASAMALLMVSAGLRGLARALSTGPLEAWYVDSVHATGVTDRDEAFLTTGLARGEVAASLALGTGTILGGLLPVALGGLSLPVSALAVPVLLGAVLEVVRAAFTLGLPDAPRGRGGVSAVLGAVPATVRSGLRLAGRNRIVLRLLLVAATTGVALAVLELVTPAWLEDVTSDADRAALVYAIVVTAGFGADAVGAAVAPRLRRRLRTPSGAAAVATTVALVASLGLSGASSLLSGTTAVLLAGIAYAGFFVGLGASGPPLGEVLHGQVRSAERATVLSVQSLVLQLAGGAGAVVAGALTVQLGAGVGFAVAAVALLAAVVLLLWLPEQRPAPNQERARRAEDSSLGSARESAPESA